MHAHLRSAMATAPAGSDEAKSGGGGDEETMLIPAALSVGCSMNQWEGGLLARAVRVVVTEQAPGVIVLEWFDASVKDPRRPAGARRMMAAPRDSDDAGGGKPQRRVGALRLQKHVPATRGACEGMHTAPPVPDDPGSVVIGPISSRVCDADSSFSVVAKLPAAGGSGGGAAAPAFGVHLEAGSSGEADAWVAALNALCQA